MRIVEGRRKGKTSSTMAEIVPSTWKVRIEIDTNVMPEETFQQPFQREDSEL